MGERLVMIGKQANLATSSGEQRGYYCQLATTAAGEELLVYAETKGRLSEIKVGSVLSVEDIEPQLFQSENTTRVWLREVIGGE